MHRFTIFGRQSCGYCHRAKNLLDSKGYSLSWVDIEEEGITKADLEKQIRKPVETVPQIFDGQNHVGGYTELKSYINTLETSSVDNRQTVPN